MNDARRAVVAFGFTIALAPLLSAQQVSDRDFKPPIATPTYAESKGPVVCVDEAHHNFHTLDGRFWAFGELLRRDGYQTRPLRSTLVSDSLALCGVLVISNAQPNDDEWDTYPTPTPAAFTPAEVRATRAWVDGGGRLLLIADHMPFAGAAASLASSFGVTFTDGFAMEGYGAESARDSALAKPTIFRTSDGTLRSHAIVRGHAGDSVTAIRTFVGQAFKAPESAEPLLVLQATFIALMPNKAWQFAADTRRVPVGGWLQGAVMRVGSGRAAFFGEAAMFSAQVYGPARLPMGMNAPGAEQNYRFVLNLMRWLTGAS